MYRFATFYAHMQMGYLGRASKKAQLFKGQGPLTGRGGGSRRIFFLISVPKKNVYLFSVVSLVQVLIKYKKEKKKYIFFFPCSLKGLGGCPLKNRVFFLLPPSLVVPMFTCLGTSSRISGTLQTKTIDNQ